VHQCDGPLFVRCYGLPFIITAAFTAEGRHFFLLIFTTHEEKRLGFCYNNKPNLQTLRNLQTLQNLQTLSNQSVFSLGLNQRVVCQLGFQRALCGLDFWISGRTQPQILCLLNRSLGRRVTSLDTCQWFRHSHNGVQLIAAHTTHATPITECSMSAGVTLGLLSLSEVMSKCVLFSMSQAWQLGRAVMRAQRTHINVLSAVAEQQNGIVLIAGKVCTCCQSWATWEVKYSF